MTQHLLHIGCFRSWSRRGGGPCYHRWLIIATVLSLGCLPSALADEPDWYYDPPCQHDFSWTTRTGETQECRYLDVEVLVNDQGVKYCKNPLVPLTEDDDGSLYPPPLANVEATYYTTEFKFIDPYYEYYAGLWSGVNFTFQLTEEGVGTVTGILFSMESLSPDSDDYRDMYCRAYEFVQPLSLDAVLDRNNNPLQFFMDCFRGQKPGMVYAYTFRTLPLMDTSGEDPHDTVLTLHYRTPSCYSIPHDFLCKEDDTREPPPDIALCSYWMPQFFVVTSYYRDLSVAMEIGPEDCQFDAFKMAVHSVKNATSGINLWTAGFVKVDIANQTQFKTFAYGRNITYVQVDLKAATIGQRVVTVIPLPTQNTCFQKDGTDTHCSITLSRVLTIIENPCLTNPCSSLEVCEPNGNHFSCVCKPGFIRDSHACVSNPCEAVYSSTQVPTNPCGQGTCNFVSKDSYSCTCNEGLMFVHGTCQVDPCVPNPCGNGTCHRHHTPAVNGMDYSCQCHPGFSKHGQICKVSTVAFVGAIVGSLVVAVLLILLLVLWRQKQNPQSRLCRALRCFHHDGNFSNNIVTQMSTPSPSPSVDLPLPEGFPLSEDKKTVEIVHPQRRINVALFSSNDHPIHEEVVHQFALFLKELCNCDVALPQWCTMDIHSRGVDEWITYVLSRADKVILLCSRGTKAQWKAHSAMASTHSDIFIKAMSVILRNTGSIGLSDRYCVAYFDYSSRNDIPAPLAVNAVYCLMKHMDILFFKLHDMKQGSPTTQLRAPDLEEGNYATASQQGAALHAALQKMQQFQKEEPNWFERFNSIWPQESRYIHQAPQEESLSTAEFFNNVSHQVDDEDFDSAMREFLNA